MTTLEVSPASELFWRMLRHEEFDIAELSMSNYIMENRPRRRSIRGNTGLPASIVSPFVDLGA
ncbi:MAG: hypothetical protein M5T61_10020 [Acidimicrobiia bacterium]|nr:hypothetical protein [Acidimicrobiia bacterium]